MTTSRREGEVSWGAHRVAGGGRGGRLIRLLRVARRGLVARLDRVRIDEAALAVGDPQLAASGVADDRPSAVEGLLLRLEMAAGAPVILLDDVPYAALVRDDVAIVVVPLVGHTAPRP